MQFAYQFPERVGRLALVSSGGLGRSVHAFLRAATLPGSELVIPLLADRRVLGAGRSVGRALGRIGLPLGNDAIEMARVTPRWKIPRAGPRLSTRSVPASTSAASGCRASTACISLPR